MDRITRFKRWDSKKNEMVHNHIEFGWKFAPEKVDLRHFNFEWKFLDDNKKCISVYEARNNRQVK